MCFAKIQRSIKSLTATFYPGGKMLGQWQITLDNVKRILQGLGEDTRAQNAEAQTQIFRFHTAATFEQLLRIDTKY
jgi:hypothetical protein